MLNMPTFIEERKGSGEDTWINCEGENNSPLHWFFSLHPKEFYGRIFEEWSMLRSAADSVSHAALG